MKVHVVGSSGTFPTRANPASGYVIEQDGLRVWCDTGPGTFTGLPFDSDMVDAIFISHRHPDHCTDFFSAYHAWTFRPDPRTGVPVYANGDVLDHLAGFVGSARGEAFGDTFELNEVSDGDTVEIGPITAIFHEASHSVPALVSRWEANGRRVFYTGDTGPGPWEEVVAGSHVLISEAALQGERDEGEFPGHLNALEAGAVARSAGVDRLVLTHIPPYLDVTVSVSEAESTFGKAVSPAVAGTSFKV